MCYLWLDIEQVQCQHEAQNLMSKTNSLKIIHLPLHTFLQLQDKKEIWVDAQLYDVNNYYISGDSVAISVYHDCREEVLIGAIISFFEVKDNSINEQQGVCINKLHSHGYNDWKIINFYNKFSCTDFYFSKNKIHENYVFYSPSVYIDKINPPPKPYNC